MSYHFPKILIIQTAFIGDVILATGLIEKLHSYYPQSRIDFLVRKGNEGLLDNHPYLENVLVWNKKKNKNQNLLKIIGLVRETKYDLIVNCQRFLSSGLITVFSGRKTVKVGFKKNPMSVFFDYSFNHEIDPSLNVHEIERNQRLIQKFTDKDASLPKLYPSPEDYKKIEIYTQKTFVCFAPASVWFTKQMPSSKWVELGDSISPDINIFFLGSPSDKDLCDRIIGEMKRPADNLAGKLSLIESAALIERSSHVYVNDSAPLHIGSAVNTPTTAFFCSTIPEFGFGPLASDSEVKEVEKNYLSCRPCGLHGKRSCPENHFKCGFDISLN